MTLQEIQALTDDEIRVRVAEACGYAIGGKASNGVIDILKCGKFQTCIAGKRIKEPTLMDALKVIPNYPADLNACHEFESVFISDYERAVKYSWNLLRAIRLEVPEDADDLNLDYCWHIAYAPARQRCEAFLAVMQP